MKFHLLIFMTISLLLSCSTNDIEDLSGDWLLANRFYGDVYTGVCDADVKEHREIKMTLRRVKDLEWEIGGTSVVNTFGGKMTVDINKSNRFDIHISELNTTYIGAEGNLMDCETEFYRLLRSGVQIRISDKMLYWGVFPDPDAAPGRDGGTFLVFRKIN
jgi:hypothetical protein